MMEGFRSNAQELVRVGFIVSCLLPGPQILAYIALWILMPKDPRSG